MYIKREKKQHMWDKEIKSETHTSSSNIETTHDVCKWLQNQKMQNTKKYINIKVYQTNSPPKLVT